jgi:hypothetical protein
MAGAQNGIMGEDFATELPETHVDQDTLAIEKNMARFSKSHEYQALKEHLEGRITYYQLRLPGSDDPAVRAMNNEQRGEAWLVADAIIAEFRTVLAAYENANEVVKNA